MVGVALSATACALIVGIDDDPADVAASVDAGEDRAMEAIGGGTRKSRARDFEDEDVSDVPAGGDEFGDDEFGDGNFEEPVRRVKKKERAPREDRELIATPRAQRESGGDGFDAPVAY